MMWGFTSILSVKVAVATFAVVTALSATFAVVIFPSATLSVVTFALRIFAVVTAFAASLKTKPLILFFSIIVYVLAFYLLHSVMFVMLF